MLGIEYNDKTLKPMAANLNLKIWKDGRWQILARHSLSNLPARLKMDLQELKYQNQRLNNLYQMALCRIDELHDSIHKLERKVNAIGSELKNVRNFSIDLLEDYGKTVGEIFDAKLRNDEKNAHQCAEELEQAFQEMIDYKEHMMENVEEDELWKLIIENDGDNYDEPIDLTN